MTRKLYFMRNIRIQCCYQMIISVFCSLQEWAKDSGEQPLFLHWPHDQQWACDRWAWRSDHGGCYWECRLFVWWGWPDHCYGDNDSNGDDNDGIVQGCLHQHRRLLSIVINCCPLLSIGMSVSYIFQWWKCSFDIIIAITTSTPQLLRLAAGDTLTLRTNNLQGSAKHIHFCVMLQAAE